MCLRYSFFDFRWGFSQKKTKIVSEKIVQENHEERVRCITFSYERVLRRIRILGILKFREFKAQPLLANCAKGRDLAYVLLKQ